MSALSTRYWDSGCFLAILKGEQQAQSCHGVIQGAEAGRIQIVTSTWTLTEVIHLGSGKQLAKEDDVRIRDFFENPFIILRPVTEEIGHLSRNLVWNQGVSKRDAIHVATALDARCPVIDTFDSGMINNTAIANVRVGIPDVPATQSLFDTQED